MRKVFFLTLIAASLILGACVEQHNLVVLDKFVPISPKDQCDIKVGGDRYYTKGYIDLAFTDRYLLPFQITNYISSSVVSDVGSGNAPISGGEANKFFVKRVEIKYEWDPRPQSGGAQLALDGSLWNTARRIEVHGVVVDPEGGQNAAAVDIFTEAQSKDLLDQFVNPSKSSAKNFDWIASPLLIKVKVIGDITDGSEIQTNTLTFNVIPTFGETIQMGAIYREPAGGFADDQEKYDTIMAMCSFEEPLINGCLVGQDSSMVNCWAGDTPWQKNVATSNCHLDPTITDCYYNGFGAASVVEVVANKFTKSAIDSGYYYCCPGKEPEAPEEEKEEP